MAHAIEVRDFSFAYPAPEGRTKAPWAVHQVDLTVEEGAFCLVTGATGSGKTTLLRCLKPELVPVGEHRGTASVFGAFVVPDAEASAAMSAVESAETVGFVMQDPQAQIVCDSVWHELAFGLENLGCDQDVMRRRVAEVAHFFGIEPWVRKSTQDLSGGQAQIVNLAGVLALRPRLILLDEPTAQLDPNARALFVSMLGRVNRELGITVVVATHAPENFAGWATETFPMSPLTPEDTLSAARRAMRERFPERTDAAAAPDAVSDAVSDAAPDAVPNVAPDAAHPCIELSDVHARYRREDGWVLRGVDLTFARGGVHALVGGNGCGKTTLLRVIAGVLEPQRGRVRNRCADRQALLPQDPKALFVCDSVLEELDEWSGRCGYGRTEELACAERFGLADPDLLARHPYDLSGGQQQKLALAKLLLTDPDLLLLDEPTKGLDAPSTAEAVSMLRTLAAEGRTVVVVTHDLDFAALAADTVTMLFDGEVAASQPAEAFFVDNLIYRPHDASRLYGAIVQAASDASSPSGTPSGVASDATASDATSPDNAASPGAPTSSGGRR
jgi:energy-coupling factor transporter ATP-binding protein EcfA2